MAQLGARKACMLAYSVQLVDFLDAGLANDNASTLTVDHRIRAGRFNHTEVSHFAQTQQQCIVPLKYSVHFINFLDQRHENLCCNPLQPNTKEQGRSATLPSVPSTSDKAATDKRSILTSRQLLVDASSCGSKTPICCHTSCGCKLSRCSRVPSSAVLARLAGKYTLSAR